MIDQKKRTYHLETSSLLPLKLVLIEAEKGSPPRVHKEQKDANEELALKLIASMKHKHFVFKPRSRESLEHKSIKKANVLEP